ncbi:MAG: ParB/RepB/Spo0J family partition protein [Thermoleophilaceae bacterium]
MAESRGMGRGLAAILPSSGRNDAESALRQIPVELIRPNPEQPRKEFNGESLLALAESIEARGILQPLVVRALPGGAYELIAGERRLRAAKIAKLEDVPAIVRDAEGAAERLELALLENVAREDLNPVDEARACATLVEDLGVSKAELAGRIGKSRPAVANAIRLLDLPDDVLELIERGELTGAHGRALLMCRDHGGRRRLAREALTAGWSVKETERHAKAEQDQATAPKRGKAPIPADLEDALAAASDALTAATGRDVQVKQAGKRFKAEIAFDSPTEAIELAERLLRRSA